MKKIFLSSVAVLILSTCCRPEVNRFAGSALGTVYSVSYTGNPSADLQEKTDSVLHIIDGEFSVFDTVSMLSRINRGEDFDLNDDFIRVLGRSLEISRMTGGAFDCTLQPLVELWGFGRRAGKHVVSQEQLDSVMQYVGCDLIAIDGNRLIRRDPRVQLNFNAIAKGYAADRIASLLVHNGYSDFVVEVGGEVVTRGTKNGKAWKIGIQVPTETADGAEESFYALELRDRAIATSGNYRSYFEEDGRRYAHILNPATGRPEQTALLSVTVVAADCMTADACATAFMVMGMEQAMQLADSMPDLEIYFIYDDHGRFSMKKTCRGMTKSVR